MFLGREDSKMVSPITRSQSYKFFSIPKLFYGNFSLFSPLLYLFFIFHTFFNFFYPYHIPILSRFCVIFVTMKVAPLSYSLFITNF